MDGTVLIADDDRSIRTVLSQALTRAGCAVHATASLAMLERWITEGRGDLVITDVNMPDGNGLDTLPRLRARRPDLPFIVISAQNSLMTALRAQEADAWDYLPKPFDLPDLMARVAKGLAMTAKTPTTDPEPTDLGMIGTSAPMQQLYRQIARSVARTGPVLVLGETGTGKTHVARLLHDLSARKEQPCCIIPAREGLSPQNWGNYASVIIEGTQHLSQDAQQALITVLDQANAPRIIATGAPNLAQDVSPALYHRLAQDVMSLPPLRQRPEDIPAHVTAILGRADALDAQHMHMLRTAPWPGNTRQLLNLLHGLQEGRISADEIATHLTPSSASVAPQDSLSALVHDRLSHYFAAHGAEGPPPGLYQRVLAEVERPLIQLALEQTQGNQGKSAQLLGINRNTLRKKIQDLGIEVSRHRRMM